jgi:hypothetical protein
MEASELFRTCANEHVADAALSCIGGGLVSRIETIAERVGQTRGALVARLVEEYDRKASPSLRRQLDLGMGRDDMPILAGLRHVLEQSLLGAWEFAPRRSPRPVWRSPVLNWAAESTPFAAVKGRCLHS